MVLLKGIKKTKRKHKKKKEINKKNFQSETKAKCVIQKAHQMKEAKAYKKKTLNAEKVIQRRVA